MIVRIVRSYKFSNGILSLSIFRDKALQENRDFYKLWAKSRKNIVRVARLGSTVHNLAFTSLSRAFWLALAASSASMNVEEAALCLRACVRTCMRARIHHVSRETETQYVVISKPGVPRMPYRTVRIESQLRLERQKMNHTVRTAEANEKERCGID